MKQGKKWTQAEKDYVRDHYKERGALVARDLDRSLASVQKYARMLGVAEKRSYSQQLCWRCKWATNPINNPCPWSRSLKPVKGWTAEYTILPANGERSKPVPTFKVVDCPLFVRG